MCKYYLVEVEKRGNMKRRLILLLLIIMLAAGCGVAKDTEQSYQRSETVMDTVATLSASGPNAKQAVDESMTRLKVLEAMTLICMLLLSGEIARDIEAFQPEIKKKSLSKHS